MDTGNIFEDYFVKALTVYTENMRRVSAYTLRNPVLSGQL